MQPHGGQLKMTTVAMILCLLLFVKDLQLILIMFDGVSKIVWWFVNVFSMFVCVCLVWIVDVFGCSVHWFNDCFWLLMIFEWFSKWFSRCCVRDFDDLCYVWFLKAFSWSMIWLRILNYFPNVGMFIIIICLWFSLFYDVFEDFLIFFMIFWVFLRFFMIF